MGAMDERRLRGHGPSPQQVRIAELEKALSELCEVVASFLTDTAMSENTALSEAEVWAAINACRKVCKP